MHVAVGEKAARSLTLTHDHVQNPHFQFDSDLSTFRRP